MLDIEARQERRESKRERRELAGARPGENVFVSIVNVFFSRVARAGARERARGDENNTKGVLFFSLSLCLSLSTLSSSRSSSSLATSKGPDSSALTTATKKPSLSSPKKNYYSHQNSQVLDDSTDKTTRDLVDDKVAEWRERGVNCYALRRTNRSGYKAGALKEGLEELADYDYIAIFDADFKPEPDFLTATVPYLIDNPEVSFFFMFFASLLPLLCTRRSLLLFFVSSSSSLKTGKTREREREREEEAREEASSALLSLPQRERRERNSFFLPFFSHPSSFPLFLPLSPTPPPHHPPTTNPRSATSSPAGPLPTRTSPT